MKYGLILGGVLVVAISTAISYISLFDYIPERMLCRGTVSISCVVALFYKRQIESSTSERDGNVLYITSKTTKSFKEKEKEYEYSLSDMSLVIPHIMKTDPSQPLKLVICTTGGNVDVCFRLVKRLKEHPSGYIVYCNEAYSGGAFISLYAKEVVMNTHSFFGKIDPQQYGEELHVRVSVTGDAYKSALSQTILNKMMKFLDQTWDQDPVLLTNIKDQLIYGRYDHATTFYADELKAMGFTNIREPTQEESDKYMHYYLQ